MYTIGELAKIVNVPAARLRRWVAAGLLEPTETKHRLAWFDFAQAAQAHRLGEWMAGGVTLRAIRRALEQLRQWLPAEVATLARLEHDGRLLVRVNDRLLEPSGQLRFDFDDERCTEATVALLPARHPDALFDAALACEDEGHLAEALALYEQALSADPHDPDLHFNRGNALCELGRNEEAVASYRAALDLDEEFAEAWNNLGQTLIELDDWHGAEAALRRATELVPGFEAAQASFAEAQAHLRHAAPLEPTRHFLRVVRDE